MAKGCKIPVKVQQIIMWMSSLFKNKDISIYIGLPVWSIERILQYFKTHGTVEESGQVLQGPRKHLRDINVEVSITKSLCF